MVCLLYLSTTYQLRTLVCPTNTQILRHDGKYGHMFENGSDAALVMIGLHKGSLLAFNETQVLRRQSTRDKQSTCRNKLDSRRSYLASIGAERKQIIEQRRNESVSQSVSGSIEFSHSIRNFRF
jgi:hypothetical protein